MQRKVALAVLTIFLTGICHGMALAQNAGQGQNEKSLKKLEQREIYRKTVETKSKTGHQKQLQVKKIPAEFKDVQSDWSREEVLEARVKGFVDGYEDLTFRPNVPVTQMEMLALLLKVQGMEDQVKNCQLSAEQTELLKKIPDWGKNYVAVALQQGLLTTEEVSKFNPQEGAKRYEVCRYMARVLEENGIDIPEETQPVFTDENEIPDGEVQPVRLMWTYRIAMGYPGGKFNPMSVVKRSEMAALLNRLDDNCLQRFKDSTIKGSVKDIEPLTNGGFIITVLNPQGEEVQVTTNQETKMLYEGHLISTVINITDALKIKVLVNEDGEAILVRFMDADSEPATEPAAVSGEGEAAVEAANADAASTQAETSDSSEGEM